MEQIHSISKKYFDEAPSLRQNVSHNYLPEFNL